MSDLRADLPIWSAEIYHSEPGATNPWIRVFNINEVEDHEVNRSQALRTAVALFVGDGLNYITIYRIELAPLKPLEGGE